jgi:hypothetical protein
MNAAMRSTFLRAARRITAAVAPKLYRRISFYRNEGRLVRIAAKLVNRYGANVLNGPFKGMRYVQTSVGSVFSPKLVGSYEAELHPFIERVTSGSYDVVIDIGCAEGYYAVGFLFRMKTARCVAFDSESQARTLCREMAELNCVSDRIQVRGCCDAEALSAVLLGRVFILADCEGAELDLLDPVVISRLRDCDALVELHDFIRPGLTLALQTRFAATHEIQIIEQQVRDSAQYPELGILTRFDRHMAVQEFRPGRMQWAMLTAKAPRMLAPNLE